ncbi:protein crumbs homolog 3b [Sardina pilchardus]|uniref:protein crumbs homolog 3b n=1 Tax=Sardina pilchardus TaxID=27697 RepID=UPI002E0E5832
MLTAVRWGGWLAPVALLILTALTLLTCVLRKRRAKGTYQPSHEEKKQTRHQSNQHQHQHQNQHHGAERPGLALPLPKEERLI